MCLLSLAGLPEALPQGIPRVDLGGVMLDGSGETLFRLLAVLREDVESSALQAPVLDLGEVICVGAEVNYCHANTTLSKSWDILVNSFEFRVRH